MTKLLARQLSLPLTLHRTLAPGLAKIRAADPDAHKYDDVPPEAAFAAAAVVVLKMVYGLDGLERCVPARVSRGLRELTAQQRAHVHRRPCGRAAKDRRLHSGSQGTRRKPAEGPRAVVFCVIERVGVARVAMHALGRGS